MKLATVAVAVTVLLLPPAIARSFAQLPPKAGKIESLKEPSANFASFTTYSWERGYDAHDPAVHKLIVQLIDAEMARRGFTQVKTGANVTLRYYTVLRTDVIMDKLDEFEKAGTPAPTKKMGRLVVVMKDAKDKRVWAADTVQPLNDDSAVAQRDIKEIVPKLFDTYPIAPKK